MSTAPLTWQILLKPVTFPPSTDKKGPPHVGILEARDRLVAANFGLAPTAVVEHPAWDALEHSDARISVLMVESRVAGRTIGNYAAGQDLTPAVESAVRGFSCFLWKALTIPGFLDDLTSPDPDRYPSGRSDLPKSYPEEPIPWATEQKFHVEVRETGLTDQGRTELLNLLQQYFPEQGSTESLKLITV